MKSRRITPGPPSKGWTLALAGLATFMTALDTLGHPKPLPGHAPGKEPAVLCAALVGFLW